MLGADGGDYNILGQFEFTGGRLDMTQNKNGAQTGTQEELTIENLDKAGGTFIMDTDLNNEEGDQRGRKCRHKLYPGQRYKFAERYCNRS